MYITMRIVFLSVVSIQTITVYGNYIPWSPDKHKNMWCPNQICSSKQTDININHCCACHAKPIWELPFSNMSYDSLAIEIFDVKYDRTKLMNTTSYSVNETVFVFTHQNGKLRKFPENSCDFNIVTIDVTNNKFTEMGGVSCFENLDTLIMKNNLITHVSNDTFTGLKKLRNVILSFNPIKTMDLNVISSNGVLDFDFESSQLPSLDVSNIAGPGKTMCGVNFSNNKYPINVTNIMDFQIGNNSSQVCNDINLSGVTLSPMPLILMTQNIDSVEIAKFVPCGKHRYEGSKLICDCELAELFHLSYPDILRLYNKTISEYFCETPDTLYNMSMYEVYSNQSLYDKMVCDVKDYCHSRPNCHCKCNDQPSRERLVVDCSNQSCEDFPNRVPDSKYRITLLMSNNNMRNISAKDYFSRIDILDVSNNPVQYLHPNIQSLEKASEIRIFNHTLQTLPKSIQNLHPDIFRFGKDGIPCNCENQWIGEWRKFKRASKEYALFCSNYDHSLIEDIYDEITGCEDEDETTGIRVLLYCAIVFFSFILMLAYLWHQFHFYLLIFKRKRLTRKRKNYNKWETDVYISFDEENNEIRGYVIKKLDKNILVKNGMTTFIPCRDVLPGINKEDAVIENIKKCKYVLILQSPDMYMPSENFVKKLEYNMAWEYFLAHDVEKILVISFGPTFEKFRSKTSRALHYFGMGFMLPDRTIYLKEKILRTFEQPLISNSKYLVQGKRRLKKNIAWNK